MSMTSKIILFISGLVVAIFILAEFGEHHMQLHNAEVTPQLKSITLDKPFIAPEVQQQIAQKIQAGEWRYEKQIDDISGQHVSFATVDDIADDEGANSLLIRNSGKRFEAYIATKRMLNPQYDDVYSSREIGVVAYNEKDAVAAGDFSDNAHPIRATFHLRNATDAKAVFIVEARDFANFIANCHKDTLRLKLQFYDGDIHTFIFRINNFDLSKVQ